MTNHWKIQNAGPNNSSQRNMGWLSRHFLPVRPVGGEVFLLTSPFIEPPRRADTRNGAICLIRRATPPPLRRGIAGIKIDESSEIPRINLSADRRADPGCSRVCVHTVPARRSSALEHREFNPRAAVGQSRWNPVFDRVPPNRMFSKGLRHICR